jgi:hypothetical protein
LPFAARAGGALGHDNPDQLVSLVEWLLALEMEVIPAILEVVSQDVGFPEATLSCLSVDAIQRADILAFISRQLQNGYASARLNSRHGVVTGVGW